MKQLQKKSFTFENVCNIIDKNEDCCICNIADHEEKHGKCTYFTCVNGYDEENDCYWVDGEYFSDYDEEKQEYIK